MNFIELASAFLSGVCFAFCIAATKSSEPSTLAAIAWMGGFTASWLLLVVAAKYDTRR